MHAGARGRRALLVAAAAWAVAARAADANVLPAALREPALPTPKARHAAMLAVTRAGERLVAAGERGIVLLSDDHGASWRQAQVPVQATLTSVRFVDARVGWAAGHLGTILRTEDGGQHWALQLDGQRAAEQIAQALKGSDERAQRLAQRLLDEGPDKPFFDLEFIDAQRGVAVGAYNFAMETVDGGRHWSPLTPRLPNPKNLHLYAVRAQRGSLFVAGEQGLLLRSDDGGASFQPLPSPYKGSFFGIQAARTGTLVAYGLRGNAFRSADLGANWHKLETGTPASIVAAAELEAGTLVLLSQTGELLASRDDGASFSRIATHAPGAPSAALASARDGALAVASLRGMRRLPAP